MSHAARAAVILVAAVVADVTRAGRIQGRGAWQLGRRRSCGQSHLPNRHRSSTSSC